MPPSPVRRLGRPPRIDRAEIVAAVLAVGFESLTMTAVADRLGTVHSALYHHVRNRADLVTAALDALADALPDPPADVGWRAHLRWRAHSLWDLVEAHPGLGHETVVHTAPVPAVDAIWAADLQRLVDAGFPPADAALALDTVLDLPFDVAVRSQHLRLAGRADAPGHPSSAEWFAGKLEIVLAGITARLAPSDRN